MEDDIYKVKRTSITRIEDNPTFQKYFKVRVKDVPYEDADVLLTLFLNKAAVNMGKDAYDKPDATRESILEFIYKDYRELYVFLIASAIIKGSLGNYGAGRLVPSTVYKWLGEMRPEIERMRKAEEYKNISHDRMKDLDKYPIGSAINKKIDWYKSGLMSIEQWDMVPLKELAEAIARGQYVTAEEWLNK